MFLLFVVCVLICMYCCRCIGCGFTCVSMFCSSIVCLGFYVRCRLFCVFCSFFFVGMVVCLLSMRVLFCVFGYCCCGVVVRCFVLPVFSDVVCGMFCSVSFVLGPVCFWFASAFVVCFGVCFMCVCLLHVCFVCLMCVYAVF